jgi:hypothetical protein
VTDGIFAGTGANGALTSAWADAGRNADAEQETSALKPPPRFASLRADGEGTGLGPKRVPGAGPRPGGPGWGTTGPLPFRTVPRPASNGGSEPAVTGPQPVLGPGPVASAGPAAGTAADTPAGSAWDTADTAAGSAWDMAAGTAAKAAAGNGADATAGNGADSPAAEIADSPAVDFDSFATGSQPDDDGADLALSGTGPHPVLGAPAATTWEAGTSRGAVIVPPTDGLGKENRLPIFEAVESDWFRRGRQAVGRSGGPDGEAGNGNGNGWASPADEGWRAAEAVHAPSSGGITSAGLPKRVPRANLVPGAAGAAGSSATAPARSAAATRDRFASFQRGAREGRAAASGSGSDGGEDESSG